MRVELAVKKCLGHTEKGGGRGSEGDRGMTGPVVCLWETFKKVCGYLAAMAAISLTRAERALFRMS